MIGLWTITALVAAVVIYFQETVPLGPPSLARADVTYYWPVALIAGLAVLILSAVVAWLSLRIGRGDE